MDVIVIISSLEKDRMPQYQSAVDDWTGPMVENIRAHLTLCHKEPAYGKQCWVFAFQSLSWFFLA